MSVFKGDLVLSMVKQFLCIFYKTSPSNTPTLSFFRQDLFLHVDEDHTRACFEEVQTFDKHGHSLTEKEIRCDDGEHRRLQYFVQK